MLLRNVDPVFGDDGITIQVKGSHIEKTGKGIPSTQAGELVLTFNNALAFPGLINSHDHLDFNLFPQFGDRKYANYTEWGEYIHKRYKDEITRVLNIPLQLREDWGMIKNLICGVTTVVNHGEKVKSANRLINIYERCQCLHSVGFEKGWRLKLNNPKRRKLQMAIHAGEGTDTIAHKEIDKLTRWNLFGRKLIGIHGVAMSQRQAKKFRGLVWCPQSNFFLLDKTAQIDKLKAGTNILFGTDSTLTAGWDIWSHIRDARETGLLSDNELFDTLNKNAAQVWRLPLGKLKEDKKADIVITRKKDGQDKLNDWFTTRPGDILLVVCDGNIKLFDEELLPQLSGLDISPFSKINVDGVTKYICHDVPELISRIKKYYPEAVFPVTLSNNVPA